MSYSPKCAVALVVICFCHVACRLFVSKVVWYNKTIVAFSDGDMTICSPSTGYIALGQYYLPKVNKSSCHPHSRATIVYYILEYDIEQMRKVSDLILEYVIILMNVSQ